jgi:hypothetical protein
MAKVTLSLKASKIETSGLARSILRRAKELFTEPAAIAKIKEAAEEAVNKGVEASKDSFTPTYQEAIELGIGEGGSVDFDRINGAYRVLRTDSQHKATTVEIIKSGGFRSLYTIKVNIDEAAALAAPESNIPTPDSDKISNIPWMDWLINGSPTLQYRFFDKPFIPTSRTGGGVMVKGGVWSQEPRRPFAFGVLSSTIELSLKIGVAKDIGEIVR